MAAAIDSAGIHALHAAGDRAAALPLYTDWLAANPGDAGMWSNFGALLRAEGRRDQALRAHERAYALAPKSPRVLANLANLLTDLGLNDRALELRHRLLDQTPDNAVIKAMIGKSLRALGRAEDSVYWLLAALADHPADIELRLQLALSRLACGRYVEGFRDYAVRWQTDELTPRSLPQPKWDGVSPLAGRSIAVLPEQGFGDTIAFARFLPVLKRAGAGRVMLHCQPPLLRLLQGIEGADLVAQLGKDQGFDLWTDLMDLPALGFAEDPAVPAPARLAVPDDSVARAARIAAPLCDRFRVGVVWTGSLTYRGNAMRSFDHQRFLPLTEIPGVQLVSLYKGPAIAEFRADGSAAFILDAGSSDRDFADCAALMRQMDLVITSDTATAHLAGSLGLPVWTLLHWDAFWLWRHTGDTTAWYPSMRLIRQPAPRDWDAVFDTVARDLAALAAARKALR